MPPSWLDSLLARHGELQALSSWRSAVKGAKSDVRWTYASVFSHVQAVSSGICGALHSQIPPSGASTEPVGVTKHICGEKHIIVCGPAHLQSVAAIVCSLHGYVGVFVPAEDTHKHTVSNLHVVQRSCDAEVILIDEEVWNGLSAELKNRLAAVQDCAPLVFSDNIESLFQVQPRGKLPAAYLVPAPSRQPPAECANTRSTGPLFIFHQRGKHEAVTLSYEATEAYMQHGIKNLVQAVDPSFTPAAPVTSSPVEDNHVRIRSCTHVHSEGNAPASSILASPSCTDVRMAPGSLIPGSFTTSPKGLRSRRGSINDATNSAAASVFDVKPSEQPLQNIESTLTPRSKSLAPVPDPSSYMHEPECTGSIPACTPCFMKDEAHSLRIPSDCAALYQPASLCSSYNSGCSYQGVESFLSSRSSFITNPHGVLGANAPTMLASQDIFQAPSTSNPSLSAAPIDVCGADGATDDVIKMQQHDALGLPLCPAPLSTAAHLTVAQVQGLPAEFRKGSQSGALFSCGPDVNSHGVVDTDHAGSDVMGRAISTAIPAEMFSGADGPMMWSQGEMVVAGEVVHADGSMEPTHEPCTVERARRCDELAARVTDVGNDCGIVEELYRSSVSCLIPSAGAAETELCTVQPQNMHDEVPVLRATDSVLLPLPSMHAMGDAGVASEQSAAVSACKNVRASAFAQKLTSLSVPGLDSEQKTPPCKSRNDAARLAHDDYSNESPRLVSGAEKHLSPFASPEDLCSSKLSMLTPQQLHPPQANLVSPSLASLSPEVLNLQDLSMHDASYFATPQHRVRSSPGPCMSPECIVLREASAPEDVSYGDTCGCEALPASRQFVSAQRGIRFDSTTSPSPGRLRVAHQSAASPRASQKRSLFDPARRLVPSQCSLPKGLIPTAPSTSTISPTSSCSQKAERPTVLPSEVDEKSGCCAGSISNASAHVRTDVLTMKQGESHAVTDSVEPGFMTVLGTMESCHDDHDLEDAAAVAEAFSDSMQRIPHVEATMSAVLLSEGDAQSMQAYNRSIEHGCAGYRYEPGACQPCVPPDMRLRRYDSFVPMWHGGAETEEEEDDRRGAPVAVEIDFAGDDSAGLSSKIRDAEMGDSNGLGGFNNEGQSLPWRSSAWSGSSMRMRTALGLEGDAETIDSWPSGEDVVSGRRRPGAGVSIRQPHLLCGLPADTPTRLLFGLLLPLSMGWHVTLAPAPAEDPQGDKLWHLLCCDDTGVGGHASEGAVPYDACYIASAACDMLTRHALEALGGRASSLNGVGGSAAFSAALSKMAVCALFGPSATPATIQSFVASMLPFGLRRTAISFVCSTWDLPVLCPPLLGLHTLETGVRCAAGDCVSPLGHVAVVATASRCALPDGAIGNIWVASGGPDHAVTRGIHAVPLQWVFDAARNERKGPYKVTGLAGYMDNGRLFIIGRYVDMLFAPEAAHHASDIEAALLGNTPSFSLRSFVLKLPGPHSSSTGGRLLQPATLNGRTMTFDASSHSKAKARGGFVERATGARAWLTLARKSCQSISGAQDGRRGGWWGHAGAAVDAVDKGGYGRGGLLGGGVAMGRSSSSDEKQKPSAGVDNGGAVLVVQTLKENRVAKSLKERIKYVWQRMRGMQRWHSKQQEQEIVESLAMLKMAWGVQVKEVWSVDSQLPATPMGNVDRSAATFFNGDVRVFKVDEDARKLRSLEQPVC